MPPSAAVLCLLPALLAPALSAQSTPGAITGTVRNETTGEPVRRAAVTLRALSPAPGTPPDARSATIATGPDGAFRFDFLAPGEYQLTADRAGFLGPGQARAGRTLHSARVHVEPGVTAGPVELLLQPAAVVTGRVLDEEGEPVPAADVALMRRGFRDGAWRSLPQASDRTRDTGDYRIAYLPPGRYWVAARATRAPMLSVPGAAPEAYVHTFYPSAPDVASATPITLTPGMVAEGIDIRLRKGRIVRVGGRVEGALQDQLDVRLSSRDPLGEGVVRMQQSRVDAQGRFFFPRVETGEWWLELRNIRGAPWNAAWLPLEIGSHDIDDLVLRPSGPGAFAGRARVEGPRPSVATTPGAPGPGWFITLTALEGPRWHSTPIRFAEDGTFRMPEVPPGRYRITAYGGAPEAYLKAVHAGGVESADHSVAIVEGGETHAELVFALDMARFTGVVTTAGGDPASGVMVTFVATRLLGTVLEASGRATFPAGDDGRFGPRPIAPGEYLVQAWETLEDGAQYDPELRERVQRWTRRLTLRPGETTEIELTAIPAAAMEAP
jgi:hypothetical protein